MNFDYNNFSFDSHAKKNSLCIRFTESINQFRVDTLTRYLKYQFRRTEPIYRVQFFIGLMALCHGDNTKYVFFSLKRSILY